MSADDVEQRVVPLTLGAGLTLSPIDLSAPLCGARMKGFPLLHLLDAMDKRGPQLAERWRSSVPEQLRAQTERRAVTSVAWIPIEFYFHGVGYLARELHGEGPRNAMRVGHETASADIGAFFRFILSMASPATVLGLSGRFWKSYFDVSSLSVTPRTSDECVAVVRDWPLHDEVSLHEMAGSLVAWMEASRARDVRMTRFELLGPGHFTLECRWS